MYFYLLLLVVVSNLITHVASQTPRCSLEPRHDFISDADYADIVHDIRLLSEGMCGELCAERRDNCIFTSQFGHKAQVQAQLFWPEGVKLKGDCASSYAAILHSCIQGGQTPTPKTPAAHGKLNNNGAYFSISFTPFKGFDHNNPIVRGLPADLPGDALNSPAYTFYVTSFLGNSIGWDFNTVAVHGAGTHSDCLSILLNYAGFEATIFEGYPAEEVVKIYPRYWLTKLDGFKLQGTKNGMICGLDQTFAFTKNVEGTHSYDWWDGVTQGPTGYCDIIDGWQPHVCADRSVDGGMMFETSRLLACSAFGSPSYCMGFGGN